MILQKSQGKLQKTDPISKKSQKTKSFARSTHSTNSGQASLRTSAKKLSFAELFAAQEAKFPSLKRNQEVTGKIVSVSHNEILVDIGAKSEGVITGQELTLAQDLIENLSVGNSISATVLYPENDAGQVVLSLRKLSQDARWRELEEKKKSNEDIKVVAIEVNRGGVICEFNGIRGFLPASQLGLGSPRGESGRPASQLTNSASELSSLIGKGLTVRVIEVDRKSNRLILTQKEPDKKDIKGIAKLLSKIKIGDKLSGVVTAVLPFGVFVEVEVKKVGKLEGLVHVSEIAWEKIEDPAKYFKVADKVEVVVIAKEESTGRLNLSIKQLFEDPFTKISQEYTKDKEVKGDVTRVTPYGVIVEFAQRVEGLIHISKIPPNVSYEVGQAIVCSVESVDAKNRKITLVPVVKEKPVLYR